MSNPLQGNPDGKELRTAAGRWLKQLREAANLTQHELARAVGMEYYTTISQIERGSARVPPDRMAAFAAALGMERRSFGRRLLSYYDPHMFELVFGAD